MGIKYIGSFVTFYGYLISKYGSKNAIFISRVTGEKKRGM